MTEQPPDHYLCLMGCGRPRRDRSHLCGGCFARLRGDLATVGWVFPRLGETMETPPPAIRGGTRHGSSESAPPLRLDLVDVRVSIEENLVGWAKYIAENHAPAIRGPVDHEVPTIVDWMLAQTLPWVSDQPWVWELAEHVAEHRRNAYRVDPWERLRIDLPVPCPACRALSLATYPGDHMAVCTLRACGYQTSIADLKETRRWIRRQTAA